MNKITAIALTAVLAAAGTISGVHGANADFENLGKKNVTTWNFTGGKKAEKVKYRRKGKKRVTSLYAYVNNKKAGDLTEALLNAKASKLAVFKLKSGGTYLYIYSAGNNKSRDIFYKFTKGKFRLLSYHTISSDDGADVSTGVNDCYGNSVVLSNVFYGFRTGSLSYERVYTLKGDRFVTKNSYKVNGDDADLIAKTKMNFVEKPDVNDVAFALKKGESVKVKRILFKGKKSYIYASRNGKKGYLRNMISQSLYFRHG